LEIELRREEIFLKTAQEFEKEIIDSLKEKTGRDLQSWLGAVKSQGMEKRTDILNWLKKGRGLIHSIAIIPQPPFILTMASRFTRTVQI